MKVLASVIRDVTTVTTLPQGAQATLSGAGESRPPRLPGTGTTTQADAAHQEKHS